MRLLPLAFTLLLATVLGLGVTWFAVTHSRGLDVVRAGAWEGWPRAGTAKADPYARAAFARSGELPLELADGLLFLASTDDAGQPLDGRCETRIVGILPQARLWTLTVMDQDGHLIPNDAGRYGFTSAEVVYRDDGAIDVRLSPRARAGNWLPTGARPRLKVALRLYDAPFSFTSGAAEASGLPRITREACQ
ncbi:DUF1214 domain-containing protein [Xanthobacter sp. V3C-3]|uniref:DUF1214 domain-containing protein n=1 Tax=Xanthobacter lutulentifluminis TaxID=3119935 RepID=UPI0037295684